VFRSFKKALERVAFSAKPVDAIAQESGNPYTEHRRVSSRPSPSVEAMGLVSQDKIPQDLLPVGEQYLLLNALELGDIPVHFSRNMATSLQRHIGDKAPSMAAVHRALTQFTNGSENALLANVGLLTDDPKAMFAKIEAVPGILPRGRLMLGVFKPSQRHGNEKYYGFELAFTDTHVQKARVALQEAGDDTTYATQADVIKAALMQLKQQVSLHPPVEHARVAARTGHHAR
jgi:hypothetical protein